MGTAIPVLPCDERNAVSINWGQESGCQAWYSSMYCLKFEHGVCLEYLHYVAWKFKMHGVDL